MNDFSYKIAIFIVLTIMVSVWSTNIINHYTTNSKFYHYEDPIVGFTDENIEKINIGMSKKAVEAIFGKPSQKFITTITTYFDVTNKIEKWSYVNNNEFYFKNGRLYKYDIQVSVEKR